MQLLIQAAADLLLGPAPPGVIDITGGDTTFASVHYSIFIGEANTSLAVQAVDQCACLAPTYLAALFVCLASSSNS